jgi:Glycosyl transferase family 2
MGQDKIVLLTHPTDQGDILRDYIEWHLELGVDFVVAQDCMSSDGTHDILDAYARRGQLYWFPLPERNMLNYNSIATLAKVAIESYQADWLIMTDVDEFLCPRETDLRAILAHAGANDFTLSYVPCFNMTGRMPKSSERATETLTLRVDRPSPVTREQRISGNLPAPYIFLGHPSKTIIRASAFVEYGPGTHNAVTSWGRHQQLRNLHILHYPIRGFDKFQTKVAATAAFFEQNPHLENWWAAHWRRWIRLNQEGRLRQDYENQFVSPARGEQLIRDGICSLDETISNWLKSRSGASC